VQKTINGVQFELSEPYAEGHVCSAIEARVLNQTRSENIGNNTRAKIKEMQEGDATEQDILDYVAGVDADYVFTAAGVSASRKLDPVEREARKLAREFLKDQLSLTGRKLTVAPDGKTEEEWEELVAGEIDRLAADDTFVKIAKKNVEARQKQSAQLLEALGEINV